MENEKKYTLTEQDIINDLKIDFDELFEAKIDEKGNSLELTFTNGQKFIVSVKQA